MPSNPFASRRGSFADRRDDGIADENQKRRGHWRSVRRLLRTYEKLGCVMANIDCPMTISGCAMTARYCDDGSDGFSRVIDDPSVENARNGDVPGDDWKGTV